MEGGQEPPTKDSAERKCCEYHNALPGSYREATGPEPWSDGAECGLAGMGTPSVCCQNCPQAIYFIRKRGITPDYVKEIMALSPEERP